MKLPGYSLSLGYVIRGRVYTLQLYATNPGYFPVTFHIGKKNQLNKAVRVCPQTIKALPVGEEVNVQVNLDMTAENVDLGSFIAEIPIQVHK